VKVCTDTGAFIPWNKFPATSYEVRLRGLRLLPVTYPLIPFRAFAIKFTS